jgi:glycosyltransferase involved in cell wall biosynthesis
MDVPTNAMVVLSLGRFVEKKGFSDLLGALTDAVSEANGRPVYLILAGSGPLEAPLKLEADRLGIGERVVWPGWVADPSDLFGAADIFVCPSRDEPLGNVILEAWSHGLPVISTSTAGGNELVNDGSDGLLVEPGSAPSLSAALDRLLKVESDRERLGCAGLATVRQRHSVEVVVDAYTDLYSQADRFR